MRLRTVILGLGLMAGAAWAQNLDTIQNTRDTLRNVQTKQTIDQNAALAVAGQQTRPAAAPQGWQPRAVPNKPAAGASQVKLAPPASAKRAVSASARAPKPARKPVPKMQPKTVVTVNKPEPPKMPVAVQDKKVVEDSKKKEPKEYTAAGRRDPFISPVVSHEVGGSGCTSGKRCLAVDQIALTGIVKSDAGMIAVVVNSMNKAYFLRENDPIFNGYVVKITGDSVVFSQTIEDKLGKPFTREVTKKIATPAV
jgi:Tfp pilus assembly protein PilP